MNRFLLAMLFVWCISFTVMIQLSSAEPGQSMDGQWDQSILELQESIQQLSIRNQELIREQQRLAEAVKSRENNIQEMIRLRETLEPQKHTLESALMDQKAQTADLENKIKALEKEKKILRDDFQFMSKRLDQKKEEKQKIAQEAAQLVRQAREIHGQYLSRDEENQKLLQQQQEKKLDLEKFFRQVKDQKEFFKAQLSDLKKHLDNLEKSAAASEQDSARLKQDLTQLKEKNDRFRDQQQSKTQEHKAWHTAEQEKLTRLEEEIQAIQQQKARLNNDHQQKRRELRQIRRSRATGKVPELQQQLREIRREHRSLKSQLSRSQRTLDQAKRRKEKIKENLLRK